MLQKVQLKAAESAAKRLPNLQLIVVESAENAAEKQVFKRPYGEHHERVNMRKTMSYGNFDKIMNLL